MKQKIFETVFEIISPFLAFFLIWLKIKVAIWLDSKIKDQKLKNTMSKVNTVILDVVKEVEQQYVSKERNSSEDKTLTPESAAKAKDMALHSVVEQLGEVGLKEVKKVMNMDDEKANKFISSKIEASVFDLKNKAILILPLVFMSFMACATSPVAVTASTINAHEKLVAAGDAKTADWYTAKSDTCLKNGISVREDALSVEHKPEAEAKAAGSIVYKNCMVEAENTAKRVVELVEAIRAQDKVAARVALAVARKEKPVEALGYVVPEVVNLIKQLTDVVEAMK